MTLSQNNTTRYRALSWWKQLNLFYKKQLLPSKLHYGQNLLILGNTPYAKIPKNGEIILGDNVVLNSDIKGSNTTLTSRVKFVTGYTGKIRVGDNCDLNGVCIVAYDEVEIGDYCQFASSTLITDTDFHAVDTETRKAQMSGKPFDFALVKKEKIVIGNNCWIGWGSIILKGVRIGNNCIVAAGTVCVGNSVFPDNCVIAGNPGHIVKYLK